MVEALGRKAEGRRELPQHGPELFLEAQNAGGEEIGERGLDVAQPSDMGDKPRRLDREEKSLRGLVVPAGKRIRPLQPVKRAVDLDRLDLAARIGKLAGMRQALWVEGSAPSAIGPAGDADPHRANAAHHSAPSEPVGQRRPCCGLTRSTQTASFRRGERSICPTARLAGSCAFWAANFRFADRVTMSRPYGTAAT